MAIIEIIEIILVVNENVVALAAVVTTDALSNQPETSLMEDSDGEFFISLM